MNYYKFLDVGCKRGGSFIGVSQRYGYKPSQGLGIDINKTHVNEFIKTGNHAIIASAEAIPFPNDSFELVIFNHVLEHMPSEEAGFNALRECIRVSSKLIVIGLPYFDEDQYLNSLKLKTFYSDWTGHKNHVHFKKIIEFLGPMDYKVTMRKKLEDSFAEEILPINAPKNSLTYNQEIHGFKEYIKFDRDIWREYEIAITK
jgi:ubiquinone/menaquinone biosynthesis C-methylase UbiE